MPRKKEPEKYAVLGRKDCWHVYGLQGLPPKKFALVVSSILNGRHALIRTKLQDRTAI